MQLTFGSSQQQKYYENIANIQIGGDAGQSYFTLQITKLAYKEEDITFNTSIPIGIIDIN
jgi:hypothetical protein